MTQHRLVAAVALAFGLEACASAPIDPNAPEACVTIDNTDSGGAAGQVYLIKDRTETIRIGEVPMGRSVRHCIKRAGLTGNYQIEVRAPSSDRIDPAEGQTQAATVRSETFRLNPGVEIAWNVRANRIRLLRAGGGAG